MAQQRENKETELKVSETLTLCTTPIPTPPKLSGNDDSTSRSATPPDSLDSPADELIPTHPKERRTVAPRSSSARSPDKSDLRASPLAAVEEEDRPKRREVNRCVGCRRKVGLTGFRCRCGELFCSEHRYTDRHDCSFDYKTYGREAIARENPVVRASKILKV
ncbi:zinc finger A20 and AN1 domain-containing stress-associated protein 5-like [Cornus florida]|uniref:zinc finger A20 and AN1 domain-containing stress-associated protein 5-like n=1 Tax=Cornus florida TaxID=4283 RepID=UPI0028965A0F|nr:zinc finger A20 and AN1 domain-containing stress-associated protein 5-like [Cornus florida]